MIWGLSKWVLVFDPLFATPEELRRLKSSLELSIAHSICSNELTVKRWSRLMKEHYYWGAKKDQIVFFFHHSSWIKRLMFDEMKQIQNLPLFWNMKTPWFFSRFSFCTIPKIWKNFEAFHQIISSSINIFISEKCSIFFFLDLDLWCSVESRVKIFEAKLVQLFAP